MMEVCTPILPLHKIVQPQTFSCVQHYTTGILPMLNILLLTHVFRAQVDLMTR